MNIFARYAAGLLLATGVTTAVLAVDLPGYRPDGSILLPNQWSLRPAGRQIELGDFPVNIALHPPAGSRRCCIPGMDATRLWWWI